MPNTTVTGANGADSPDAPSQTPFGDGIDGAAGGDALAVNLVETGTAYTEFLSANYTAGAGGHGGNGGGTGSQLGSTAADGGNGGSGGQGGDARVEFQQLTTSAGIFANARGGTGGGAGFGAGGSYYTLGSGFPAGYGGFGGDGGDGGDGVVIIGQSAITLAGGGSALNVFAYGGFGANAGNGGHGGAGAPPGNGAPGGAAGEGGDAFGEISGNSITLVNAATVSLTIEAFGGAGYSGALGGLGGPPNPGVETGTTYDGLPGGDAGDATGRMVDNVITGSALNNIVSVSFDIRSGVPGAGRQNHDPDTYAADGAYGAVNIEFTGNQFDLGDGNDQLTFYFSIDSHGTTTISGNTLIGGAGNDILRFGGGILMPGGALIDGVAFDFAGNTIIGFERILGGAGADAITTGADADRVEGDAGADTLRGMGGADLLMGGDGNDILEGGDGDDDLQGDAGQDTARFVGASSAYQLVVDALGALAIVGEGSDSVLDIEALQFTDKTLAVSNGTSGDETLTGGAGDDILLGFSGGDILEAGDGADILAGGLGVDTLRGQAGADYLRGGDGADQLEGGADGDTLVGDAGNDILDGGDGNDVAVFAGAFAGYAVNLSAGGGGSVIGEGTDTLIGIETLQFADRTLTFQEGGAGVDNFAGGAADDTYSAGGGKDVLDGGAGSDTLDGGDANDVIYGGDGEDMLLGGAGNDGLRGDAGDDTLDAGDGADKLFGGDGLDSLLGGTGADRMDGGVGDDNLVGGGDNDYIDGGAGADSMTGGLGNDVFIVDDLGDTTVEAAGQGYDIVRTALGDWILGANIEALQLDGGADIDGSGNSNANNLQGNGGANILNGLGGVDTINGNDGNDIIVGGAGNDLLRGGLGADVFRIATDSFGGALETDQIYDFSDAEGDRIDLSAIDAIAGGLDDAFTLVAAFDKQAGRMTLKFAGGVTTLAVDINGDGRADYQMKINGDVTGDSGGWSL